MITLTKESNTFVDDMLWLMRFSVNQKQMFLLPVSALREGRGVLKPLKKKNEGQYNV